MKPERWQQIDVIFQDTLARAPAERDRFLSERCAGDEELRAEVEALLAADAEAGDFIAIPAANVAAHMIAEGRAAAMPGRRVSHYEISAPLGAGGMGEVYLAADTRNGRRVALKLLPAYFTSDAERVRRFEQEARAVLALHHPNIVTIYEIGQADGAQFIASEFIEGLTLRQRMTGAPLKLSAALDIAIQVGSALAEAHRAGIVHRDIKPENIMLRPDGYVKVLDFGIAKLSEPTLQTAAPPSAIIKTQPGIVLGTVAYMSPEQARGLEVDARTDIWSLGVVLYELVAGRVPFEGETPNDCIAALLDREPPPLARYAREVPEALEVIVTTALTKDRAERYHAVTEMLGALRRLKQRLDAAVEMERALTPDAGRFGAATQSDEEMDAATVRAAGAATQALPVAHNTSAEYILSEIKRHKLGVGLGFVLLLMLAGAAAVGLYRFSVHQAARKLSPPTLQHMQIKRLTNSGRAGSASISPDGKYVAYREIEADGRQSLWVKQLATGTTLQVVAPDAVGYRGTTFSHDSNFIFYTVAGANYPTGALFQVPVLGGPAKKLLTDISGPVTQAPDGARRAYVYHQQKADSLMLAHADGTEARALAVRTPSDFFSVHGPAWSPDGQTIACGGIRTVGGYYANVLTVQVDSGAVKQLTTYNWKAVRRVDWLSDGSGLVVLANDPRQEFTQLWEVSYPAGEVRRIINDLNGHGDTSLGATNDARLLVMAQDERIANLWLTRTGGAASEARQLTVGEGRNDGYNGISWLPNGDLLYTSTVSGTGNIWQMRPDGTAQRQLLDDNYEESFPVATPDGRAIVFKALRADGTSHLWRMARDGSQITQLTNGEDHSERISPDGQWVVYSALSAGQERLWKVPLNGGAPVQLTDYTAQWPDVSPDGRLIACARLDEQAAAPHWQIAIIPFAGGPPLKLIDLPPTADMRVHWHPDGQAIAYADTRVGVANIWSQPVAGGPPKALTNFTSGLSFSFEFSRAGKQIACARGNQSSDVVLIKDFR